MNAILFIIGFFISAQAFAFDCYVTLIKGSCWKNYDVTVSVLNANTEANLLEIVAPKGQMWTRQSFNCQPGTKLNYKAKFLPVIWESEANKIYPAVQYWSLPTDIKQNTSAWNLSICFPDAFSAVPLPPDATDQCHCDMKSVPPLPAKKI